MADLSAAPGARSQRPRRCPHINVGLLDLHARAAACINQRGAWAGEGGRPPCRRRCTVARGQHALLHGSTPRWCSRRSSSWLQTKERQRTWPACFLLAGSHGRAKCEFRSLSAAKHPALARRAPLRRCAPCPLVRLARRAPARLTPLQRVYCSPATSSTHSRAAQSPPARVLLSGDELSALRRGSLPPARLALRRQA